MSTLHNQDCIKGGISKLPSNHFQVIIADPPYNIGKFSEKKSLNDYLDWSDKWISQCLRVLKKDGIMYIYGFSETLAYIRTRLECNVRWLVWHYTNRTTPNLRFWQRSHESILCCWKSHKKPHFNVDAIREDYSEVYKKYHGRTRTNTKGRFGNKTTKYNVHEKGALPRDVIKVQALSGRNSERVNHPTQKPLELCEKLIMSAVKDSQSKVLIAFAGSGSECVVCKKLGLEFTGFEINEEYIKVCEERLKTTIRGI